MSTTSDIQQPLYESGIQQVICGTIAASTLIPAGSVAMTDASGRAIPFVDSTFQSGGGLLGVATVRYDNSAVASATSKRMLFLRNVSVILVGKGGDAPDATLLGQAVYIADNNTVKKTKTTGDQAVTLLEVLSGNRFRVWIP